MRTGVGWRVGDAVVGARVLIAVGLVGALALGAPYLPQAVAPSAGPGWATEAEQWVGAWQTAGREGQWNRLSFMASDAVLDDRVGGREIRGREAVIRFVVDSSGPTDNPEQARAFLSADAVVVQTVWGHAGYVDWLDRLQMDGSVISHIVTGAALSTGVGVAGRPLHFDEVDDLADRYVRFWNGTDPNASDRLYARGATVEDSLLGRSVTGSVEITESVGSDEWPDPAHLTIGDLVAEPHPDWPLPPHPRGRAIYVTPPGTEESSAPAEVRLVLEADDGSGCPGPLVTELGWDGTHILWERRYHDIASVRRCFGAAALRAGWWEGVTVPDPVRLEESEPMVWAERDLTVRVFNGSPVGNEFVRWGVERFAAVDLTPPRFDSLTFLSSQSRCRGHHGVFESASDQAAVTLCFAAADVCADSTCSSWSPQQQHTLLHELGHAWMDQHLTAEDRESFLAREGLERWADAGDPWDDRGVERAAEVIAFALSADPATACVPGSLVPSYLHKFRLLTGQDSLVSCGSQR
jgi:hypothetical protein